MILGIEAKNPISDTLDHILILDLVQLGPALDGLLADVSGDFGDGVLTLYVVGSLVVFRFLSSSFRFNVHLIVLSVWGQTCQGVDRKIKFVQQAIDRFESNTYYSGA
jgi:hypothetical protein